MKSWRVDFVVRAIIKTEKDKPDLTSLTNQAAELPGVENFIELSTSVCELVGLDSEAWKKT